jgi:TolA-binding protein
MTERWLPGDAELDAVARTVEPHEPAPDKAEQNRTALLAAATSRSQVSRRSMMPYAIAGAALAAAAAVAIWVGTRPSEHAPSQVAHAKETITPIGVARFERVTGWTDFVVRLDDGKIAVQVATLEAGERFLVKTADAEVEVRGTKFDVGADQGRLASVDVHEGRVEIRLIGQQVIILSAGESWPPVKTAQREEIGLPVPAPATSSTPTPAATPARHPPRPILPPHTERSVAKSEPALPHAADTSTVDVPATASPKPESPAPAKIEPPAVTPKPGEAEFRAGMASLRAGDARAASRAFATACTMAKRDALAEDACFWAGAAAKRSGDTNTARAALAAFLQQFPSSARAPEAEALLGWILYDAGDLDAAEKLFHQADHDRVPQVRDSALRGLTAIDRKRHGG